MVLKALGDWLSNEANAWSGQQAKPHSRSQLSEEAVSYEDESIDSSNKCSCDCNMDDTPENSRYMHSPEYSWEERGERLAATPEALLTQQQKNISYWAANVWPFCRIWRNSPEQAIDDMINQQNQVQEYEHGLLDRDLLDGFRHPPRSRRQR